tara:strand:- start:5384 stop:6178 length:795 start_codon:yes stop_codon:yes gene_type:complete
MNNSLQIKPVDVDEDDLNLEELDPFIFPSCLVGIGSVASGKSTLLFNLIRIMQPVFGDNVIIFSPTFTNDPIMNKLMEDDLILQYFESFSNETLQRVLKVIGEDLDPKSKYLIVFDDILGMKNISNNVMGKDSKFLQQFVSTYRHGAGICREGQISIMFFIQHYKSLLTTLRVNTSYMMFLGKHSQKNRKQYAEELSYLTDGNEDKFHEVWNQSKSGKYDFIMMDMRKQRIYKNLDTLMYLQEENQKSEDNKIDLKNNPDDKVE